MKLELRRVKVPTPRAQDARRSWPERDSLWLELTDAHGVRGVGEASPLPDYSPDRLEDVQAALQQLGGSELEEIGQGRSTWAALAEVASLVPVSLPSARMALETAMLDLLGRRHGIPATQLLGAARNARRPLAALLGPASSPNLPAEAARVVQAGFTHLKLKVGAPGRLELELAGVRALRQQYGSQVTLRLDANGALTAAEITQAWSTLAQLDIEMFEEPGPLPEPLRGTLPLALDESLQGLADADLEALVRRQQARWLILKPMALGGLAHCWRIAERACALGAQVVISHCFDGPVAWRAAAALALALPAGTAHGLAPHAGLAAWSGEALPVRQGALQAWIEPGLGTPAEPAWR